MTDRIARAIDSRQDSLRSFSSYLWNNPEPPFEEHLALRAFSEVLEAEGFEVEKGAFGLPTAFRATWGKEGPVFGFIAEYDALPGLNQSASAVKDQGSSARYGHGCGHNLMAVASLACVLALREIMQEQGLPGTVVLYGCPAEETLTGKGLMAREGAFVDLDCMLSFHPMNVNKVTLGSGLALNTFKLHFKGTTAHASADPQNGRSALDAVELTNVGINYLREHVPPDVRMHYSITNGGLAPNIVPADASAWYYVRSSSRKTVEDTYQRMLQVAKGAAMMTDTKVENEFLGGCYNKLNNKVLCQLIHQCMDRTALPQWSREDLAFATQLNQSAQQHYQNLVKKYQLPEGVQLHEGLLPVLEENSSASTDTGDVSWIVPLASFGTACFPVGAPGHSWQITASSGSEIGFQGAMYAARCMTLFGLEIIQQPDLLKQAKAEFDAATKDTPYISPMPSDAARLYE